MHVDWIIAALGNPGERYAKTRHNIGWMVCEHLCAKHKASIVAGKGDYYQAALRLRGKSVLVIFPTTYMNDSGRAVEKVSNLYEVKSENILIVLDEYNFPLGKVHLKFGGSDGGHNGAQSVIEELGNDKFWRLRCGIAKNFGMGELVDYVLREFNADEIEARNAMITRAADAIELVMLSGVSRASSAINSDNELFPLPRESN